MNTSLESARAEVKFALTKQPGEKHAAINGDGHTIYKLEFFARSVPPAWLDEIAAKLYHEHELGWWVRQGRPQCRLGRVGAGFSLLGGPPSQKGRQEVPLQ